jgi:hypothetical protein
MTYEDLALLSKAREHELVLSVYVARESSDPGDRGAWRLRLDGALEEIRAHIGRETPAELSTFEKAAEFVSSGLESYGRVLPDEGYAAFATEERLWHAEALTFSPFDVVRWRQGVYIAPYLRTLKGQRPVTLAMLSRMHATLYRYLDGVLEPGVELRADGPAAEAADVGVSKRASTVSGMRGITRTFARPARRSPRSAPSPSPRAATCSSPRTTTATCDASHSGAELPISPEAAQSNRSRGASDPLVEDHPHAAQAPRAATFDIARSASAVMVSDGFTPGLADTADPSITYRPS